MWTFSILLQKTLPQNNDCVGWSKINACICFWCTLASEDYDGSANSQYIFLIPLVTKIIVTCFPCNGAPGGWSTPTVEPADRWAHQRRAGPHRPAADPRQRAGSGQRGDAHEDPERFVRGPGVEGPRRGQVTLHGLSQERGLYYCGLVLLSVPRRKTI